MIGEKLKRGALRPLFVLVSCRGALRPHPKGPADRPTVGGRGALRPARLISRVTFDEDVTLLDL